MTYNEELLSETPESVDRVAKFLDANKPGWPFILTGKYGRDLSGLYVSNPEACVLSALYERWSLGELALSESGIKTALATACLPGDDDFLRSLWLAEVDKRMS